MHSLESIADTTEIIGNEACQYICDYCSKPFIRKKLDSQRHFCSDRCRILFHNREYKQRRQRDLLKEDVIRETELHTNKGHVVMEEKRVRMVQVTVLVANCLTCKKIVVHRRINRQTVSINGLHPGEYWKQHYDRKEELKAKLDDQ